MTNRNYIVLTSVLGAVFGVGALVTYALTGDTDKTIIYLLLSVLMIVISIALRIDYG